MMKNVSFLLVTSIFLSMVGVGLIIYFGFNNSFNDGSGIVDSELASRFGSFISGIVGSIFTLVGFLLLYQTILEQRKQFNIQQFESKLFELIKYHRDNVSEILYTPSSYKEEKDISGRNVFIELKKQLLDLFLVVKSEMNLDPRLYSTEKKTELEAKIMNITYIIFFFGVGNRNIETTREQLKKTEIITSQEIERIIDKVRKLKTNYNNKIVFYGGHQSKLGFYFRHIYRTIKFIEEYDCLNDDQKKSYAKIYRAQLTTYEQALFFFNSMSNLGKPWRDKNRKGISLIEKYELIKNIPPRFMGDIDPRTHYPLMEYEF